MSSQSIQLQSFCRIIQGGRHGLSGNHFVPEGFPAYGAGGLNGYLPEYEFDEPAVILSAIGARCGKCFYPEGKWTSLANTQLIFPDPAKADARFLWFQLDDERRWHRSGTGQPFIKPADVKSHRVYLPSLPEQQRIAAILDKADALRAKRRAALAQLDTLTQSIFLDMFGDPATNPKGWPTRRLDALVRESDSINYGVVQPGGYCEDGVPLIRVSDLQNGRIERSALKKISPSIESTYRRSRLRGDEILISCVGSTGVVAIADRSVKGFNVARAVARIPLSESVSRAFMATYLRTEFVQKYFRAELRTVSQPTLNIKQISETVVAVPPAELQRDFEVRAATLRQVGTSQRASLFELDALFASLQHRAFRGELTASDNSAAPIDPEPAPTSC